MSRKKTKGRQKIEIKKIENDEDRMITFSKRRSGIYKKITELSTLCGTEVGFLAFSGAGNSFTFGYPSFQSTAKRFMNGDNLQTNNNSSSLHRIITSAHKKVRMNELNRQYSRLMEEMEVEKERTKALTSLIGSKKTGETDWWQINPQEINDEVKLKYLTMKYEELHNHLQKFVVQCNREGASFSSQPFTNSRTNRHN